MGENHAIIISKGTAKPKGKLPHAVIKEMCAKHTAKPIKASHTPVGKDRCSGVVKNKKLKKPKRKVTRIF